MLSIASPEFQKTNNFALSFIDQRNKRAWEVRESDHRFRLALRQCWIPIRRRLELFRLGNVLFVISITFSVLQPQKCSPFSVEMAINNWEGPPSIVRQYTIHCFMWTHSFLYLAQILPRYYLCFNLLFDNHSQAKFTVTRASLHKIELIVRDAGRPFK